MVVGGPRTAPYGAADRPRRPPTRLSTNFTKALNTSGLRHTTPHGRRHPHAALLLDAGVPVKVVSARLGHASTAFTQDRYIKVPDRAAALTAHFVTA